MELYQSNYKHMDKKNQPPEHDVNKTNSLPVPDTIAPLRGDYNAPAVDNRKKRGRIAAA